MDSKLSQEKTNLKQWPPAGIKWYYSDEWVAIAHGDCREILPDLPKVDLVLTDPPYNASNSGIESVGYKAVNEEWDKNFYIRNYIWDIWRTLKPSASSMFFCSYHTLGDYLNVSLYKDIKLQQILHWEHITAVPALAKVYTPAIEYVVWFSQKGYTFNKDGEQRNVFKYLKANQYQEKFSHPTVKPTPLICKLLSVHSNNSDTILDPFLGSGTTAMASKKLNRHCIGIEIEEKYCEIAAKRCSQQVFDLSKIT